MCASRIIRDKPEVPFLLKWGRQIKENVLFVKSSILHPEQKEALINIANWFENAKTNKMISVVVMPNGTGKTAIISCLPYMFGWAAEAGKIACNLGKPMLIIAPGIPTLKQLEKNIHYGPENAEPFLLTSGLFMKNEEEFLYKTYVVKSTKVVGTLNTLKGNCDVVISNVQKWRNKDDIPNYDNLQKDLFSVVVVDEAHHLPAPQWQKIVNKFRDHAKIIFFTATPYRQDKKPITTDQPLDSKEDFTYYLERSVAIGNKLIRDVRFQELQNSTDDEVLDTIRSKLDKKNSDCPLPGGNKHAAIVITGSKEEAQRVEDMCINQLKWRNIKAIYSGLPDKDQILINIRENKYDLVIVVEMLLEGFDHPPLSVAGILTRIQSKVRFAHFVGRIQRLVRKPEIESGIEGDIITSSIYGQAEMFAQYKEPLIAEEFESDED